MAVVASTTTKARAASTTTANADTQHKVKTAAKQRYLKAKKTRRKKRATAAKTQSQPAKDSNTPVTRNDDASDVTSSEESEGEPEPERVASPERPRKRRRISQEREPSPPAASGDDEDVDDVVMDEPSKSKRSPSPIRALPAFPLPTQPAPPSAETLQKQGLDSALLGATRVDPHTTLELDALQPGVLSDRIKKRLRDLGIQSLFAVQTALVPHLLSRHNRALYLPHRPPRDVCASAPTGSGKTLAYVVPLVELLSTRVVTRLRALIVLPTRDLVTQVREVFEAVAKGTGLKVASATGAQSFAHEQAQLVDKTQAGLPGGSSKVDVLICTPGRLIDHLDGTPSFTLEHLRFLIVDEADRLLAQSFQDWLARVLSAIPPPPSPLLSLSGPGADPARRASCQKILLSATLTRDPGRLAALALYRPQYFVVGQASAEVLEEVVGGIPDTLNERMVVCEATDKPLVLSWALRNAIAASEANVKQQALVFCKSVEAATRLSVLLSHMLSSSTKVAAYSSDAPRTLLESFRSGSISVLVCSDLVSRGLDVPAVGAVFNYDAPVDARKYVHRVGRTARAGKSGDAWTLVEPQEARWFKDVVAGKGREGRVKKVRVGEKELGEMRPSYEDALRKLAEVYGR